MILTTTITLKKLSWLLILSIFFSFGCQKTTEATQDAVPIVDQSPLETYINKEDPAFSYEKIAEFPQEGYTVHILKMTSQRWLTEEEVEDPLWWHWMTLVVPDEVKSNKGMLFIGGGSRNSKQPEKADPLLVMNALATGTVVTGLHNIPNQSMVFKGDDYGPREEDELIAYGWRRFLEGGAKMEDAKWLARLPMTKAAVRAMDVVESYCTDALGQKVDSFLVAGGSKRGWTTWTTAAMDDRVFAIAPIVIDMLNVVPSFEHHWKVYGFWAEAVGNYVEEGIMEWQGSEEYHKLISITEPFSYKDRYTMPKLLINSAGDQFFIPDSWQFYWDELPGEKHIRYVPNSDHSLRDTDAGESLINFYYSLVNDIERPSYSWSVEEGKITLRIDGQQPKEVNLWACTNNEARDFRLQTLGNAWKVYPMKLNDSGSYTFESETPESGWTAFMGEMVFPGVSETTFKLTTAVIVTPDVYPS